MIAPGVYYYYEKDVKEQWREVADYLEKNYRVSDVIVFAHDQESYRRNSFNWYYRGGLPTCSVDRPIIEDQTISIDLINCTAEYRRFWLIVNGPESVTEQFIKYPFDQNRQGPRLIIRQQFTGIVVSLFELNSGGNLDTP